MMCENKVKLSLPKRILSNGVTSSDLYCKITQFSIYKMDYRKNEKERLQMPAAKTAGNYRL